MRRTEVIIVHPSDERYEYLMRYCHQAKNLYNAALYDVKQHFKATGKHKTWQTQAGEFKQQRDYMALPRKVSKAILQRVGANYKSFFTKFKNGDKSARPPKYLKKDGVTTIAIPKQAIPHPRKKEFRVNRHGTTVYTHTISPKQWKLKIETTVENPVFITIVPCRGHIRINIVHEVPDVPKKPDNGRYMAVDLGVDNLAACLDSDGNALLFKGKAIKSINQFFNKEKARLTSALDERKEGVKTSKRLERLSRKRKHKIDWFLHNISSTIVNHAVSQQINTIIVGHNPEWKQGIKIGRVNNQKFVSIPFDRLIQQIQYKAENEGINVILQEESYTSKCSFLDSEPVKKHEKYAGRRIKRGLFRATGKRIINADINAAGNIMRKVVPVDLNSTSGQGIVDGAVHPKTVLYYARS